MSDVDITELEKGIIDGSSALDDAVDDVTAVSSDSTNTSSSRKAFILSCLQCSKEFDTSTQNCDPFLSLCHECKIQLTFPFATKRKSMEPESNDETSEAPVVEQVDTLVEEDGCNPDHPDFQPDPGDDPNYEVPDDTLPSASAVDTMADPIEGYTGFATGEDLGAYMKASIMAKQPFTVVIGNLRAQQFNQNRDPKDFFIQGKNGLFKLTVDPYQRENGRLVLYGYDCFDALQHKDVGYLCNCMVMQEDGLPSGYILIKIGKTRCDVPRIDGWLYHIRENT